eukprot:CAMPEP_0182868118 /NCGR_PEP_ID=MMETSP0034_2-20130328/9128_1 /TAXON_ID=156128 /ORGANISM="Nephroselmis pyriformis, Strain CCMP717" /LENGTH=77 /DNA_ID=CAMNT_0025000509 /DNA_START=328 /DNA_END=557 /DNA_ORIENTATION=-
MMLSGANPAHRYRSSCSAHSPLATRVTPPCPSWSAACTLDAWPPGAAEARRLCHLVMISPAHAWMRSCSATSAALPG